MDPNSNTPQIPHKNSDQDFEAIRGSMAENNPSQEEADRRARIEYLRSLTGKQPKPKKPWWRKLLSILITLIIIAGLTAGVFWYFSRAADNKKNQPAKPQQTDTTAEQPVATKTKHYDATSLGLGFDYPENWKVIDTNSSKIMVTSPVSKIKTLSGTTDGQVVFMVQSKQSTLPAFKNGNGTATRVSEKVAYAKPTQNQRAQTYMTFVSFPGASTAGIDSVFVTGDLGYQKDQAVPEKDLIGGDPSVSIFFAKCNGGTCAADPTTTRTTVADSSWTDSNPLVKAAKAVLLSLTIN